MIVVLVLGGGTPGGIRSVISVASCYEQPGIRRRRGYLGEASGCCGDGRQEGDVRMWDKGREMSKRWGLAAGCR